MLFVFRVPACDHSIGALLAVRVLLSIGTAWMLDAQSNAQFHTSRPIGRGKSTVRHWREINVDTRPVMDLNRRGRSLGLSSLPSGLR